jgi:hypothetical protein
MASSCPFLKPARDKEFIKTDGGFIEESSCFSVLCLDLPAELWKPVGIFKGKFAKMIR